MKCPACGRENSDDSKFCGACGLSLAATPTGKLNPDTILDGRYSIVRTIGQGGMGAVYLALDTRLQNKPVAIKEMSTGAVGGDLQAAIDSFKKEARILINLRHHALPVIYDFFSGEEQRWYLVMDYIKGDTLKAELQKRGPLPEAEVIYWAHQLCDILEYLHKQNPPIIFRDLKPDNIMLTPEGQIKLIDFGIARNFQPGNTADTVAYGSGGFAPPEQYGQNQTDARSDVYSLGATLHFLLTGIDPSKNPFNFEALSKYIEISTESEKAIMQSLDLNAANRPQNIEAFRASLPQGTVALNLPENITLSGAQSQRCNSSEGETMTLSLDAQTSAPLSASERSSGTEKSPNIALTISPPVLGQADSKNQNWLIIAGVAAVVFIMLGGAVLFYKLNTEQPVASKTVSVNNQAGSTQTSNTASNASEKSSVPAVSEPSTTQTNKSSSNQAYLAELAKGEQMADEYDEMRINMIRMLNELAAGQGSLDEFYSTCATSLSQRQALLSRAQTLKDRSYNPSIHNELINMLNYSIKYCNVCRQGADAVKRSDDGALDESLSQAQTNSERIQSSLDSYKANIEKERNRLNTN